ncbi:sensor histidine kinase [Lysinibacillus xylanilyticus]|uniref:sensor histidine kinase n=1 Tax=Lysinibacillus xylanilyticus TaxID=582475 RepID=UPI003CFDAE5E
MKINYKTFLFTITSYTLVIVYMLSFSFRFPLIGVEVERVHNDWIIKSFTYPEWAELNNVKQGNIVLEVDNKAIEASKDSMQYSIRSANSLLLKDTLGKLHTIQINYSELPNQFLHVFIIPLVYFLINLAISIYLYTYKRTSFQSLNIFILYILTVSLTYSSVGASTQMDRLGMFIMSNGIILSLILLIHFLSNYHISLNIKLTFIVNKRFLYGILCTICLLTLFEMINPVMIPFNTILILVTFCALILYAILMLGISYIRYRKQQLLLLFLCLIVPFLPFVLLYILPMLLFNQFIVSSSVCALFLLFIPISLLSVHLPERLFDLDYQISKIRYYSLFSLTLAALICAGIYPIIHIDLIDLLYIFLFVFLLLVVALYFKEKIDYANRKLLYSPKGDYIHIVYKTIERIIKVTTVEELLDRFTEELSQQLAVSDINIYIHSIVDGTVIKNDLPSAPVFNTDTIEKLRLGEIKKIGDLYIGCLHETLDQKYILTIEDKGKIYLKREELLCLELLFIYISNFIENTHLVEDLFNQLDSVQKLGKQYPSWLRKFVWIKLENEKYQLAQELHDTILQEQIHLIREMDIIQGKQLPIEIQQLIQQHREYLVELNQQLRYYCEKLKPPLLERQGLKAALDKLFAEINQRADFVLIFELEDIALDNAEIPLLIYRTVQELLNNAIKHSQATYVKIQLIPILNGFELLYFDNGVGCDLSEIERKNSMGLQGIKERIYAYNGFIQIESAPDEGMRVHIKIEEGNFND